MNFEIPVQLGVEISILAVALYGVWKVGRWMLKVELRMNNHEQLCERRATRVDKTLQSLLDNQIEIREDVAFIKAKLNGGNA